MVLPPVLVGKNIYQHLVLLNKYCIPHMDIQNGFRLRNAQWLQGLPPFHLRQVLGFPLLRQMRVGRDFHVNGARAQARDEGRDQGTPNQLQLHLGKCCGLRVETVAETW